MSEATGHTELEGDSSELGESKGAEVRFECGERFSGALALASRLHAKQPRKGTDAPYISHLLAVASLVLEDGGSEDETIAALLHDAVEDCEGERTRREIEDEFGSRVAEIVSACSDTDERVKPPWRDRKQGYLDHLAETDDRAVLRVSLADKLHNARAIEADERALGEALWARFNAPRDEVLWYYRALGGVYARRSSSPMVGELERTLDEIERRVANQTG